MREGDATGKGLVTPRPDTSLSIVASPVSRALAMLPVESVRRGRVAQAGLG
jgi:hypothetical protein